jgi:signal transduction histidine kinase/CheY-like chemotaxis protein
MVYEKILVVDFDTISKHIIYDTLSKQGYTVLTIDNLNTVLSCLQKKVIDILIVNLSLPEIDSIELIKKAKFIRPGIGIIVTSQGDTRDVIIKAFQEGATAILEKPFKSRDLVKVVNDVLEKSRLSKENIRLKTLLPLFKLTESLVSELNAEKVFDHVIRLVYLETRASNVSLHLLDEETQILKVKASIGITREQLSKDYDISNDQISWTVINSGKPVLINDKNQLVKENGHNIQISTLCVPLSIKGSTIGVIYCNKINARNGFTESDLELLSILAAQATIAIENARLFNNLKKQQNKLESSLIKVLTAQEDERSRISAELHDGLAQWLVSASYSMQLGEAQMSLSKYEDARGELSRANDIINQSVKELRRIILDLHPIALAELGLVGALRQFINSFNKENGVRCSFKVIGDSTSMSFISDVTIYRVALEALNNIRKHANAKKVNLLLEFNNGDVALDILDDGIGFDLNEVTNNKALHGSLGLVTMKERSEMIGGSFKIDTAPNKGTRIYMKLPVMSA